jgi:hypothetical protein
MRLTTLTLPDVALIGGTRAALGAGLALLLSRHLSEGARRGAGWALVALGALTTVPLLFKIGGATRRAIATGAAVSWPAPGQVPAPT